MQFIVEHQAKHEVEIQQLRRMDAALGKRMQQNAKDQADLRQTLRAVVVLMGDSAREVRALAREQKALTRVVNGLIRRNGRRRK